jgi:Oxygenase domain of the 2OGFeDO superfamily
MKLVRISTDWERLRGKFPAPSHVEQIVNETATIVSPEGQIIVVLLKDVIPRQLHRLAYKLWERVDGLPSNRISAVGTVSLPRSINKDGIPSRRSGVNESVLQHVKGRQGILGYAKLDAHRTTLTKRNPKMITEAKPLIRLINSLYRSTMPEAYRKQRAFWKRSQGDRQLLRHTAFSTIYIAKNFRTAYHKDSGNMPGMMTAIMPAGKFTGGELVFPRWRLAVAYKPGDLCFFDPQQLHGNLAFTGKRISAAMYVAKEIAA